MPTATKTTPTSRHFAKRVLNWFDKHGRKSLPWQDPITPYRVWLSEVMLQQTQVDTVIPYFERFIQAFPSVQDLAHADIDRVLHLWTGLGYYARARNLHRCAQVIANDYQGKFPSSVVDLESLPGIGRSTAGAISSIAFNMPEPILDGNVKRVLARHFATEGWPGSTQTAKVLWDHAQKLVPKARCRDYTQAMMDLGATLCTRSKPDCHRCPIQNSCMAFKNNEVARFPEKKPSKKIPTKEIQGLLIQNREGHILLEQRPSTGIWGGLWSLPELSMTNTASSHCQIHFGTVKTLTVKPAIKHTFSHYHLMIHPIEIKLAKANQKVDEKAQTWFNPSAPSSIGLPAPIKKLLLSYAEEG